MGTVIATVIVLAAVILAFIWTRTGNRRAGGKCSQNSGGCATCDDTACPASKTAGYTHSDGISGRRFDAVFFDMDGTLLDTAGDLTAAMNYVRGIHGLPLVPEDRVIPELGNGIINLLKKLLPENITEQIVQCHKHALACGRVVLVEERTEILKGFHSVVMSLFVFMGQAEGVLRIVSIHVHAIKHRIVMERPE